MQPISNNAGREGDAPVRKLLSNLKPVTRAASDEALCTNPRTNPYVSLHGKVSPAMAEEVLSLRDDLKVTTEDACALYVGAGDEVTRRWLELRVEWSFVDAALAANEASSMTVPLR